MSRARSDFAWVVVKSRPPMQPGGRLRFRKYKSKGSIVFAQRSGVFERFGGIHANRSRPMVSASCACCPGNLTKAQEKNLAARKKVFE
jgi:hypothetical protein